MFRYARCGLTRYYAAVCDGLRERGVTVKVPLLSSNCDVQTRVTRATAWLRRSRFAARVLDALSRRWFHRLVRLGTYDVVLLTSPDFNCDFLKVKPDTPYLMVVHDLMTCVTAPDGLFDAAGPGMTKLLFAACRATRVVCISQDTRDALVRQGVVPSERIDVVLTGNLLAMHAVVEEELALPARFLLFVGERSGRKGFYSVVQALRPLMQDYPDLTLVCTGSLTETEQDYIARRGLAGRVQAMVADDRRLVTLYRRAAALVYPSLYEGFGLPVIEAMHFGCPVVTTQNGALREVAGDAALFVDPFRPTTIEDAVRALLTDAELRKSYMERGRRQAALFPVEAMMEEFHHALARASAGLG